MESLASARSIAIDPLPRCAARTMAQPILRFSNNSLRLSNRTSKTTDDHHSYTVNDDDTKSTDETEEMLLASFRNSSSTIGVDGPTSKPKTLHIQTEGDILHTMPSKHQPAIFLTSEGMLSERDAPCTTNRTLLQNPDHNGDGGLGASSCSNSTISGISSNLSRWRPSPEKRVSILRTACQNDAYNRIESSVAGLCHHADSITSRPQITNINKSRIKLDVPPCQPRHQSISPRRKTDMSSTDGDCGYVKPTHTEDTSQSSPGQKRMMAMFRGRSIDVAMPIDCGPPSKPRRQCSCTSHDQSRSLAEPTLSCIESSAPPTQYHSHDDPILPMASESDQTKKSSSGADLEECSTSVSIAPSEIESYVLAMIPAEIRKKISPEDWNRIFSDFSIYPPVKKESMSSTDSNGSDDRKRQIIFIRERDMSYQSDGGQSLSDLQSIGELSDITFPSVFPFEHKESTDNARSPPEDSKSMLSSTSIHPTGHHSLSDRRRPWHENVNKSAAPRMPRRGSFQPRAGDPAQMSPPQRQHSHQNPLSATSRLDSVPNHDRLTPLRSVSFDTVQIRHYERVLDLNPATSSGPSLGLGWQFTEVKSEQVLEREVTFQSRRSPKELFLSRKVREEMLEDMGYTSKDVARAVRLNVKARNQRTQTINNLAHQKMEEMVEMSSRKVRQLLRFPSIKLSKSTAELSKLVTNSES